jgi:hypothetical protein
VLSRKALVRGVTPLSSERVPDANASYPLKAKVPGPSGRLSKAQVRQAAGHRVGRRALGRRSARRPDTGGVAEAIVTSGGV